MVSLTNVKLTSKAKSASTGTNLNNIPQTQYNDTYKLEYVTEGWTAKYTSVNIGFAIVVSIFIIAFAVFLYLFMTNFKRINAQRQRVEVLKKELEKINKLLMDQAHLIKAGGNTVGAGTLHPPNHQRMGTTGADRTRGTMFEGGTSPENFNEHHNGPSSKQNGELDMEMQRMTPAKDVGRQAAIPEKSAAKPQAAPYTSNKATHDPLKLKNIKESPMVIDHSSNSPNN